ncbi:MAG: glutathione S-transferase family protein [Cyanobacteria bacterium P01_H01_bin.121]
MLKLYGGARSRASIVQWYLEELGIPYEFMMLDMQAGEHKQPEFLALNPMGKVPAIVDGDFTLWESGAILLYIAEKYGQLPNTPEARAAQNQWLLFANATLGPDVVGESTREKAMPQLLGPLNELLAKQPYITGAELSVADIGVGALLAYLPMMFKIEFTDYPAIAQYVQKLAERPAFRKVILQQG